MKDRDVNFKRLLIWEEKAFKNGCSSKKDGICVSSNRNNISNIINDYDSYNNSINYKYDFYIGLK